MDSLGNTGARHAQLHAMPRVPDCDCRKRARWRHAIACCALFFASVMIVLFADVSRKGIEPGFPGAASGKPAARPVGDVKTKNISRISAWCRAELHGQTEDKIFRYHFLLGADWKLCARKLGIDRGNFFHAVYRIEQKLGRCSGNWSRTRCFRWMNIFTARRGSDRARATTVPADPGAARAGSSGVSPAGRQDRVGTASLPAVRKEIAA